MRAAFCCGVISAGLLATSYAGGQTAPPPAGTSTGAEERGQADQAPEALAKAEEKLDTRDYAGAGALLDAYLGAHPRDARALFDRGYVEDAQEHGTAAESFYRRAIAVDPQQFESRLALGLLLAARAPKDAAAATEARTELETATRLTPRPANPAAQAQAGRALARLLRTSDPEAARQALIAALKLSPSTPADTLLTAEIAEATGDPETAEEAYRGLLAAPAASDAQTAAEATRGLVHLLIAGQKYTDAELLLRKALAQNAADPVLNAQLANVLMAENKPEDALAVLVNLHAGQPENRAVAIMLADLYTQTGQAAKAEPVYAQLLAPGAPAPDEALLAARGDNLVRQQKFVEAVEVLQQAVKLHPDDGNAWSSLAFAASASHQPQLTLDALAMRSKVMSETPATYFLGATACDTLHQTKRAVALYKQFLVVAGGKFPDEEWQAKHRLVTLSR